MSYSMESGPQQAPSERLWYAIRDLELLAHELDQSGHNAAETMCLSYPNPRGNRITFSLDYVWSGADGLYAPRMQTIVATGRHLSTETILFIDDYRAEVAESRLLASETDVEQMAQRVEMMHEHLQLRREVPETKWWIMGADRKKPV